MNFVFLSPHFPPNWYRFCVALRAAGARVLGIADAAYDSLRPELRGALAEYYRVGDMQDYDQLVRAMGHLTHRHGKLDAIDSLNEYWLETEALLRTDFNLVGVKSDRILNIKRKSRMKEIYRAGGIPVARGRVARTFSEARGLADETGYPLVAKPDVGVGAVATWKLDDERALERFFERKPPGDYILEEFVQGRIVTFDGLVDQDGRLVFSASLAYGRGIMETVNEDDHVFYYTVRDVPSDLEELGRRTLSAFDVRGRFFHLEFFRNTNGGLVALEVNMRPPGGLTTDMWNYANDIDVYREWANVVVHNRFEAIWSRPYFCGYVGRKYSKRYAHSHEAILAELGPLIVHHERMDSIFRQAIGDYGYLVRSPDEGEILEAVRFIHELC
ncbi:MAG TPA: ATP-grasp domain-containing protein [Anaeromyxobacteraceae bacterium]|nr:ATP-grasp domain-containing protein [Anaeromyxobacteraceae bacterium]